MYVELIIISYYTQSLLSVFIIFVFVVVVFLLFFFRVIILLYLTGQNVVIRTSDNAACYLRVLLTSDWMNRSYVSIIVSVITFSSFIAVNQREDDRQNLKQGRHSPGHLEHTTTETG